ncbi:hypothetical protein DXG01_004024 [Tephrocybe rancida]|nr:hypothetical protein DXG01_004024 [Tephrocybe rancida]
MSEYPKKRARVHVAHERVPLNYDVDYTMLRSRNEGHAGLILAPRATFRDDFSWTTSATWVAPRDDNKYGLDPNGDWHDEELENPVFADPPPETQKKPKQKSKILRWSGTSFSRTWLKDLGLVVQLNHISLHCSNVLPCPATFKILHTNGIHPVTIRYCGCKRALPHHIQLLRRGLYPANQMLPETCVTFSLLRFLHQLSLTSKASTYNFYRALEKMMTNTGLDLLKQGGRGHVENGVATTKEGKLVVPCLTCPRQENLPEGWEKAPVGKKFLYAFILCMDANFRLKNQLVSSFSADPGLGIGWAYMMPLKTYKAYVLSQANAQDISTCVGFSALAKANTKFSKGLQYTGVGAVTCGWSEMFLPCGVGNLQKGERYPNMDLIFASFLCFIYALYILISYDIACQWFIHLLERMDNWPESYQIPSTTQIRPALPKMHEAGHARKKHERLSLCYLRGVGLTDGESVERMWAGHNALGNAMKIMGPGTRHDVLDDHFGFWNWQKYMATGNTLVRRYKDAVLLRNSQVEAHHGLTSTISTDQAEEWERVCRVWEDEPYPKAKSQNPFHVEGATRLKAGGVVYHSMSASAFLTLGLELEEEQRRVTTQAKTLAKGTTQQHASLTEQRNQLWTKLRNWEQVRSVYMPGLLQYQTDHPPVLKSDHPEDSPLLLPSSIPANKQQFVCIPSLAAAEEKLRTAQCHNALNNLQHILNMKSHMVQFKNANIRGQQDGTWSRAIITRIHDRDELKVLLPQDVRSYTNPERLRKGPGRRGTLEDDAVPLSSSTNLSPNPEDTDGIQLLPELRTQRDGTGETRRMLSWIWLVGGQGSNSENNDLLCSEWAKSRARAARAKEEVVLLKEEMQRATVTLEWRADWWMERASLRRVDAALAEGLRAYAEDQASLQHTLQAHFLTLWKDPLSQPDNDEDNINCDYEYDDSDDGEHDIDSESHNNVDDVEHSGGESVEEQYPNEYEDDEDDL